MFTNPKHYGDIICISGGTVILIVDYAFKGSASVSSKVTVDLEYAYVLSAETLAEKKRLGSIVYRMKFVSVISSTR
jgi:hypothetical protein